LVWPISRSKGRAVEEEDDDEEKDEEEDEEEKLLLLELLETDKQFCRNN